MTDANRQSLTAARTWWSEWRATIEHVSLAAILAWVLTHVQSDTADRVEHLVSRIAADPMAAAAAVVAAIGAFRLVQAAWKRDPNAARPTSPPKREDGSAPVDLVSWMGGLFILGGVALAWMRHLAPVLVLGALVSASGCGASALQGHATAATVAMHVTAAADDVVEAEELRAVQACPDVPCVDALHARFAPIATALDSLRLALLAWGAAVATAAEADGGEDALAVVLSAARAALGLWPGIVDIAAQLGVTLPPLPAVLLVLIGAAS